MLSRLHWSSLLLFIASALGAGLAGAVQGCGVNGESIYTCDDPIRGRRAHNGEPDPCCHIDPCHGEDAGADADTSGEDAESSDASDGGPTCSGVCIDVRPNGWDDPELVWFGPPGAEPECPANAKTAGFDGFEGVEAEPAACACVCTPSPGGTCGLTTTFKVNPTPCPPTPGPFTPFNAPSGWDGSCTSFESIAPGALCNGSPCVQSLTAAPLTVLSEQPCAPVTLEPLVTITPPKVKAAVRGCRPPLASLCGDAVSICAPSMPGFKTCIYHDGDAACPAPYSDKHVVAAGLEDDRACTACSCGTPSGGYCTATLNVFTDGACGASIISASIASSGQSCFDIMPSGVPLGSKSITDVEYVPGSCAVTGGVSVGNVTPTGTATFCCLP